MRSGRCQIDLAEKVNVVQQVKDAGIISDAAAEPLSGQGRVLLRKVLGEYADAQNRVDGHGPQAAGRLLKDKHARRAGLLLRDVKETSHGAAGKNLSTKSDKAEHHGSASMRDAGDVQ